MTNTEVKEPPLHLPEALGRKEGMTQVYDENGRVVPVTRVRILPAVVVGTRTTARDGYEAVILGYEEARPHRLSKPVLGQFPDGVAPRKLLREVRVEDLKGVRVGREVSGSVFAAGEVLDVTGTTKGRGTAGVVKRHGFAGGPETHGSNFHRRIGSAGSATDPSRTFPGNKFPGRMGGVRRTVRNLRVVAIEDDVVLIRGAVPGANGGLVTLRRAVRKEQAA